MRGGKATNGSSAPQSRLLRRPLPLEPLPRTQAETQAPVERDVRAPSKPSRDPRVKVQNERHNDQDDGRPVSMHRVVGRHGAGIQLTRCKPARNPKSIVTSGAKAKTKRGHQGACCVTTTQIPSPAKTKPTQPYAS